MRNSHPPEPLWVPVRCKRLLRPLVAGLNALKLEKSREHACAGRHCPDTVAGDILDSRRAEQHGSPDVSSARNDSSGSQRTSHGSINRNARIEGSPAPVDELDVCFWASREPKVKRTYTRHLRRRCTSPTASNVQGDCTVGEPAREKLEAITIPTPYLRRSSSEAGMPPVRSVSSTEPERLPKRRRSSLFGSLNGRKSSDPLEAVNAAFESILRQTAITQNLHPRFSPPHLKKTAGQSVLGAPSLVSMCLRKVPACIADEKEERRSEDPDDRSDVTAEVYEMLADSTFMGMPNGAHLRIVVRAHAFYLIEEGIRDETFSLDDAALLVKTCVFRGATVEFDSLHKARFETATMAIARKQWRDREDLSLRWLVRASKLVHLGPAFLYRQQARALCYGVIPFMPRNQQDKSLLQDAIVSLHDPAMGVHASFLLCEALKAATGLAGRPSLLFQDQTSEHHNHQAQSLASSLCAFLVGLIVANSEDEADESTVLLNTLWPIRSASDDVLQRLSECRSVSLQVVPSLSILVADIVIQINTTSTSANERLKKLIFAIFLLISTPSAHSDLPSNDQILSNLTDLLMASAQIYRKASPTNSTAFAMTKRTVRGLLSSSSPPHPQPSTTPHNLLHRLALDTALAFASTSPTPEHTRFARDIERTVTGAVHRSNIKDAASHEERSRSSATLPPTRTKTDNQRRHDTPAKQQTMRWEEGLCEWVLATPVRRIGVEASAGADCATDGFGDVHVREDTDDELGEIVGSHPGVGLRVGDANVVDRGGVKRGGRGKRKRETADEEVDELGD